MVEVPVPRFEQLVEDALDGIPPELGRLMSNVAVFIEERSPQPGVLGLYEGIPLTARGADYSGVLPDRITLYHRDICAVCADDAQVVEEVRTTVVHEVAHHFGIDDDRLEELGW